MELVSSAAMTASEPLVTPKSSMGTGLPDARSRSAAMACSVGINED